jgi:hypothetical protein
MRGQRSIPFVSAPSVSVTNLCPNCSTGFARLSIGPVISIPSGKSDRLLEIVLFGRTGPVLHVLDEGWRERRAKATFPDNGICLPDDRPRALGIHIGRVSPRHSRKQSSFSDALAIRRLQRCRNLPLFEPAVKRPALIGRTFGRPQSSHVSIDFREPLTLRRIKSLTDAQMRGTASRP